MKHTLYELSISQVAIALIPLLAVLVVLHFWGLRTKLYTYATGRMLLQLVALGFFLEFLFTKRNPYFVISILCVMLMAASWISLRTLGDLRKKYFFKTLLILAVVDLAILALVIFGVIRPTPWFQPTYVIPLAGMIFANSMNTISLCSERFQAELRNGCSYLEARKKAAQAALIPATNMFFAVGLVSLPGMMTGQILAGVDPLIAIRYQILVMSVIFGASGLSAAWFLWSLKNDIELIKA